MKEDEICELKRRIEFNLTESETLVKLVEESQKKGEQVQKQNRDLMELSRKIADQLQESEILFTDSNLPKEFDPLKLCSVGIDGSFYPVGVLAVNGILSSVLQEFYLTMVLNQSQRLTYIQQVLRK